MREDEFNNLVEIVGLFCEKHGILVPDMSAPYIARKGRARRQQDQVTTNHFYRVDIFIATLDKQLQEIRYRFNGKALELLAFSAMLEPKDGFQAYNVDEICSLSKKHYPIDFTSQAIHDFKHQLQHFMCDAKDDPHVKNISTLQEVCQHLAQSGKSKIFYLFDRLIRLILTLPVSTATAERAFSAMKIMKTRLRNKMEDDYLTDSLLIYIERKISRSFTTKSIIEDFKLLKDC